MVCLVHSKRVIALETLISNRRRKREAFFLLPPCSALCLAPPFSLSCARSLLSDQISARTCSLPRSSLLCLPRLAPPFSLTVGSAIHGSPSFLHWRRHPSEVRRRGGEAVAAAGEGGSTGGPLARHPVRLSPPTQNSYSDCLLCWTGVFHCVKCE